MSQGEVWDTISWTIRRGQLANPTNDYSAAVRRFELGDYLDAVGPPAEGQRGFIAAVRDGEHISFYADILGSQELYARLHERLWKSVAPEAKSAADRSAFVDIERSAFVFVMAEASRMELGERRLRRGFIGTICLAGGPPAVSALVNAGGPIQISVRRELPGKRLASRPDHSLVFRRGDFPELGSGDS